MIRQFLINVDLPSWARWYAVDCWGEVHVFEDKPYLMRHKHDIWFASGKIEWTGITLDQRVYGDWTKTRHRIERAT